jgi:hypothetical protein
MKKTSKSLGSWFEYRIKELNVNKHMKGNDNDLLLVCKTIL